MGDAHLLVLRLAESHPGKRVGRPWEPLHDQSRIRGYDACGVFAHQPIQAEEDSGVVASVDLQPPFKPDDDGMLARVEA
jgi:hypothetical protein